MKYLIGLDVGTSGAKCIMIDETGKVIASSTQEYPLYTPKPNWAEQNPEDWWQGVVRGLKVILEKANVDPADILGLSYSGQMHGLVALDADNNVIRPAILWCDQRTQKQCDWITERAGGVEGLLTYTNNRMLTGYTGGKILWLRDEEPENFRRMKIFQCPKDYIRFRMTGELLMDVSDASGTGFFDTRNRRWSDALIEIAGLDKAIFPKVVESTALAGRVTKETAALTGLPEGLPCYAGGGDAVIQAVGSGLVKPGVLGVVIGTSGNVTRITPTAICKCSAATNPDCTPISAARCPRAAAIAGIVTRCAKTPCRKRRQPAITCTTSWGAMRKHPFRVRTAWYLRRIWRANAAPTPIRTRAAASMESACPPPARTSRAP